ncbi:MAG: DUF5610 domain-containing protein [Amphritea sp.]
MAIQPVQGQAPLNTSVTEQQSRKVDQTGSQDQMVPARSEQSQATPAASLQVDINAGSDSLALLYRTTIDQLNRVLETDLGPNATDHSYDPNLDITPEATASRIALLSTSFFSEYREQHPEMELKAAVKNFIELASGGINVGFIEARNILDGLQVMEGGIALKIDTTFDLVQDGLKAFANSVIKPEIDTE